MNTQDHAHKKFPLYLKFPCSAELVLDTEAAEWGGAHKGRRKLHFHTTDGGVYGRDYTLTVDLPAMGSFLLRLTPEAPTRTPPASAPTRPWPRSAVSPAPKIPVSNICVKMSRVL